MPLIDLNGLGHFKAKENAMVADAYSASKTYAVGDYVYYNGTLYRCTTAISTAEAWTAGHWTAAKLGDDCSALKSAFTEDSFTEKTDASKWAQGYWAIADGTVNTSSATWIRTVDFITDYIVKVYNNANLYLYLQAWDKTTGDYVGTWNGSAFSTTYTSGTGLFLLDLVKFRTNYLNYNFRITVTKTDNANINPTTNGAQIYFVISNVKNADAEITELQNAITDCEDIIGKETETYSANIYVPGTTAVTNGKYIQSDGTEGTDSGDWNATGFIAIRASSTLTYSKFYLTSSSRYSAFYDEEQTFVSSFKPTNDGAEHTVIVPATAAYVRFSLKNSDVTRFTASAAGTFEEMSLKTGTYISGNHISDDLKSLDNQLTDVTADETNLKDYACYKRTYNPVIYNPGVTAVVSDKYIKSDGTVGDDSDYNATNFLPVKPGAELTYKNYYLINSYAYAAYYDRDQNPILPAFKPETDGASHTLTVPANAKYVRFSIKDSDLDRFTVDVKYRDYDYLTVPSYYFTDSYLPNKVSRIREIMDAANGNYDAFLFITDMHWLMNQQHSPALIKYITDRVNVPRLFDGGDRANGINKECNEIMKRAYQGKNYFIIGNHEYIDGLVDYDGNVDSTFVTDDGAMYTEYNSCRDDVNTDDISRGYYYIDNPVQKMRYIILASFAYDGGEAAGGGYEDAQLTWFTGVVNDTPAGYCVLVLTHFLVSTTIADYRKRFTNVLVNYTGDAKIIGIIEGHNHRDQVFSSDDEAPTVVNGVYTASQVPILSVTCDKNERWQSGGEVSELQLQDRPDATIKEQAFDVIMLDKTNKVIHQIRIGCPIREGTDPETWTEMEERKTRFYDIT